ncbi:hypothetical protein F4819DRAFT_483811 [Hypoxylon fuscum]|nr:hypothetical protein F4819DRAFT_483811 [Hypoxylon fuscum]
MPSRERHSQAQRDADEGASMPKSDVPVDLQKILDSQPELEEMLKKANALLKVHNPPLKMQDLQDMLPKAQIDESWTAQDELQLQQDWQDDPKRPYLLDSGGNKHIAPLWRYTMRFMGMPVEQIIGPRFDLGYNDSSNRYVDAIQSPHPHWSSKLCEKLWQLASHPLWMDEAGAMAICLQYVVKCRTNDQRPMRWPRENHTTDKFFDLFSSVNQSFQFQNGAKTIRDLRVEVDRRLNGRRSRYSLLFKAIESRAFRADHRPLTSARVETYLLSTEDLTSLTKALDAQVTADGAPLYRPVKLQAVIAKAARQSHDLPRDADLSGMREQVLLGIRRDKAKAAKIAAMNPQPIGNIPAGSGLPMKAGSSTGSPDQAMQQSDSYLADDEVGQEPDSPLGVDSDSSIESVLYQEYRRHYPIPDNGEAPKPAPSTRRERTPTSRRGLPRAGSYSPQAGV